MNLLKGQNLGFSIYDQHLQTSSWYNYSGGEHVCIPDMGKLSLFATGEYQTMH